MQKNILKKLIILATFSIILVCVLVPKTKRYFINTTTSLPLGIYQLSNNILAQGETVVFQKPSVLSNLKKSWLIKDGVFIKKITAVPGDKICTENNRLVINDVEIGLIKSKDRNGDLLPSIVKHQFCRKLSGGEFWTGTNHPNSFDSRYYGPIQAENLKTVKPLILF